MWKIVFHEYVWSPLFVMADEERAILLGDAAPVAQTGRGSLFTFGLDAQALDIGHGKGKDHNQHDHAAG